MPQLTKGAAQALQKISGNLDLAWDDLDNAWEQAKSDPEATRRLIRRAQNELGKLRDTLADDVRPLLERQAPEYERRLADLEAKVDALLNEARVVPFRREA